MDSGHTAKKLKEYLFQVGAKTVRLVALLDKSERRSCEIAIDHLAFWVCTFWSHHFQGCLSFLSFLHDVWGLIISSSCERQTRYAMVDSSNPEVAISMHCWHLCYRITTYRPSSLPDFIKRTYTPIAKWLWNVQCPDEFVVGYGMDYMESYRTIPYIGVLKPELYQGWHILLKSSSFICSLV